MQKLFLSLYFLSLFVLTEAQVLVKERISHSSNPMKEVSYEAVPLINDAFSKSVGGHILEGYVSGSGFCLTLMEPTEGDLLSTITLSFRPKSVGISANSICLTDNKGVKNIYTIAENAVVIKGESVRLRRGPSTNAPIFNDPATNRPAYPSSGDILACLGQDPEWYKVSYCGEELYVSKRFSELYKQSFSDNNSRFFRLWSDHHQMNADSTLFLRRPVAFSTVQMDDDGNAICVGMNREFAAIFTTEKDPAFVLEASPSELHILPAGHCVRRYVTQPDGYKREELYFFRGEKLKDVWTYTVVPEGEDGKASEPLYTKTVFGHETSISEQEYRDRRRYIEQAKEYDFVSKLKL